MEKLCEAIKRLSSPVTGFGQSARQGRSGHLFISGRRASSGEIRARECERRCQITASLSFAFRSAGIEAQPVRVLASSVLPPPEGGSTRAVRILMSAGVGRNVLSVCQSMLACRLRVWRSIASVTPEPVSLETAETLKATSRPAAIASRFSRGPKSSARRIWVASSICCAGKRRAEYSSKALRMSGKR